MLNLKNIIILCSLLLSGCNPKISPKDQIELQIPLIPIIIGYDSMVYAKALQQQPSDLTKIIYDVSISKAMLLKKLLSDSGKNDTFENDIEITQINSLCIMGKFILSEKYRKSAHLQGEVYQEFYEWLSAKQQKWEKLIIKEDPRIFDISCQNLR